MGLQVAHTADLEPAVLQAARALLDDAFDGDFSDHDWEHSLGGVHALVWDGPDLVGHAALVARRLLHGGRALRAGYVEGVAVSANQRRRGHASVLMQALEGIAHRAYDLGALSASSDGAALYVARGWELWRGPTSAMTPAGIQATPDGDGSVYVLPGAVPLDLAGELSCDWREGDLW